jgi:protein-disulfide isomerase
MKLEMHRPRLLLPFALILCAFAAYLAAQAPPAKKSPAPAKPAAAAAKSAPAPGAKSGLDKAALETYVRHLFVWGPQIKVEVGEYKPAPMPGILQVNVHASAGNAFEDKLFYISKDGSKMMLGNIFDISQNPFKQDLDKLKTELQPSFGTPGAPVVLVLFSDFQCQFCKDEAKMVRTNVLSTYPKQVRVYYKDYPLEQIHPWAKTASIAGRCIFRQNPGAFWEFHDWIYEHQQEITLENIKGKVADFAKGKDIDALQLNRCLETRATEAEVDKNIADAKALGINSTPTLFVNGRRMVGQQAWPSLRAIIDFEIEYQKTAKNAGEDCGCEVKLPTPTAK